MISDGSFFYEQNHIAPTQQNLKHVAFTQLILKTECQKLKKQCAKQERAIRNQEVALSPASSARLTLEHEAHGCVILALNVPIDLGIFWLAMLLLLCTSLSLSLCARVCVRVCVSLSLCVWGAFRTPNSARKGSIQNSNTTSTNCRRVMHG